MPDPGLTRRGVLRAGAALTTGAALAPYAPRLTRAATAAGLRHPDSLPDPNRPAGTPTQALPFDHIVVVMQENHSFDNYLGMLPRRGQPAADGFAFDAAGQPTNSNPVPNGYLAVQRAPSLCQPSGPGQSWRSTHEEMDGGRMDGFARHAPACMLYWDQGDIPFYYSLATTFAVGDRWFSSAPCQTYPNRRFLMAATAFGLISTDTSSVTQDPPNGTIFDRLDAHGITWRDYYSDVPATAVIFSVPEKHPANMAHIGQFYADCAAGTLPAVSFVDSDIGLAGVVADATLGNVPAPFAHSTDQQANTENQDEEGPANISLGENFVSMVVNAVLKSPSWPRILLVWVYDEHGGYYDHVPPPAAIKPDSIPPRLGPDDPPGGYDLYGPRVPAVVVSGYARPHSVTSVLHDHTSILATIQAKWNLPAMTYRDANATTLEDFLDLNRVRIPEPPALAAPSDLAASQRNCTLAEPTFAVHPRPPSAAGTTPATAGARHLVVRFFGRHHRRRGLRLVMYTTQGTLSQLTVELLRHRHVVARAHLGHLGSAPHRLALHRRPRARLPSGRYQLVIRSGNAVLLRRRVRVA